jgi:hypothetical protein
MIMHILPTLILTSHLLIYPKHFYYFSNLIMAYKFNNMRFIYLIMLSDFIQVLNSAWKFYNKNQYFSNHKLFSTNSLL